MSKWLQIAGDMTWERHGLVLAQTEPQYRQVNLVRVEPWIEHDHEAAVSHGLYLVDEKTVHFDDLDPARSDIRGALRSVGMDLAEYEGLGPEHKAEILASYAGYDESRSVDKLADALRIDPKEIEFWGGPETLEKLESYDQEMRREALEANFETRLTFGRLPAREALEFALGGEPLEMSLQGQDALAFAYATALAGVPGRTDSPDDIASTVQALSAAPPPSDLSSAAVTEEIAGVVDAWERRYGDPSDEEHGIAAAAQSLASSIMTSLGFEWI